MLSDNFMWFQGSSDVIGETTDSMFSQRDAFEVMNFSFNMNSDESTESGKGAGASAGKAKFASLTVTKVVDSASTDLYKACSKGMIFPNIMMGVRKAGGDPILYLQYIFRYNQITGISWEGGSGTERVRETLTITFKAMGMQYIQQKPDSSLMPGKKWFWSTVDQGKGGTSGSPTLMIDGLPPPPMFLPGADFRNK
jgi:type VI secretion system secreted protein Hcp